MKFWRERHQRRGMIQYVNNSQITGTNTMKSHTEFVLQIQNLYHNGYGIEMIQIQI